MTTYIWSALADGTLLAFNPSTDTLNFDDSGISAPAVAFNAVSTTQSVLTVGGKTVALGTAPTTLTATNVYFANGGRLLVGDGTTGSANEAGNNVIDGGAAGDRLYGLDGDDTLRGGGRADVLDAGAGLDTAIFSGKFTDYSLAGSLAAGGRMTVTDINGADGTDKLTGIERLQLSDASVNVQFSTADEFKINATITDDQYQPLVTKLVGGGFVVTWQADLQDGSGWAFTPTAMTQAARPPDPFKVNATVAGDQYEPSVTALRDGGFVVTWCCNSQAGAGLDIYGQRFDASGAVVGAEFLVNCAAADSQEQPSVTPLADGSFVVTWMTPLQGGSEKEIVGQRFHTAGDPAGEVSLTSTGDGSSQTLRGLGGNDILVRGMGNDTLDGSNGFDTAVFSGPVARVLGSWVLV